MDHLCTGYVLWSSYCTLVNVHLELNSAPIGTGLALMLTPCLVSYTWLKICLWKPAPVLQLNRIGSSENFPTVDDKKGLIMGIHLSRKTTKGASKVNEVGEASSKICRRITCISKQETSRSGCQAIFKVCANMVGMNMVGSLQVCVCGTDNVFPSGYTVVDPDCEAESLQRFLSARLGPSSMAFTVSYENYPHQSLLWAIHINLYYKLSETDKMQKQTRAFHAREA